MKLIISSVVVHLICLVSIFDIYFKSPIIHNVPSHRPMHREPARRVVLFVADGLRAESLFKNPVKAVVQTKEKAPFLSSLIEKYGCWGVSHTRVPTESRPGHVALLAGFYEDPSAIAKGWKENPIEFDSVFNQSRYSWLWGSPDIVPMFARGQTHNHIYTHSYSAEEEDFSGKKSTTLLDIWVFDKVQEFFNEANTNFDLRLKLHQDKIIFFLHLLGLDTAGHTHKPHSPEHRENIRIVDEGVRNITNLINNFYGDQNTTFIFTSDHGMTDWGSHGAGSLYETETPLIAWGAGIKNNKNPISLTQADLTPLITTLLALPIPINSVGKLPYRMLNITSSDLMKALFTNAQQLVAQYEAKKNEVEKSSIDFLYKPFWPLSDEKITYLYNYIRGHISSPVHSRDAVQNIEDLMDIALEGLNYYQNYYQQFLLRCIAASFIGWIFILFICLIQNDGHNKKNYITSRLMLTVNLLINITFFILLGIASALLYIQSLPVMFYVYTLQPILIWWQVFRSYKIWYNHLKSMETSIVTLICLSMWYLLQIEILILVFHIRFILVIPILSIMIWPIFNSDSKIKQSTIALWFACCILLAIFPTFPVIGTSYNPYLIGFSGIVWIICGFWFMYAPMLVYIEKKPRDPRNWNLTWIQIIILIVAIINLQYIESSLSTIGLPLVNQYISWCILLFAPILPLVGSSFVPARLCNIMMSFISPFVLLSITYEPLFLLVLFLCLYLWVIIENKMHNPVYFKVTFLPFKKETLGRLLEARTAVNEDDFRRAYFLLAFILIGFFGTGNMASINSFDPMWVRCYITIFSPFIMGFLLLIKIIIPFVIITCAFCAVNLCVKAPVKKLFIIVFIYSDILGLQFLYQVKNVGSWLEIGSSISHYVIMETIVVFLLLLYGIAKMLTEFKLTSQSPQDMMDFEEFKMN